MGWRSAAFVSAHPLPLSGSAISCGDAKAWRNVGSTDKSRLADCAEIVAAGLNVFSTFREVARMTGLIAFAIAAGLLALLAITVMED